MTNYIADIRKTYIRMNQTEKDELMIIGAVLIAVWIISHTNVGATALGMMTARDEDN